MLDEYISYQLARVNERIGTPLATYHADKLLWLLCLRDLIASER